MATATTAAPAAKLRAHDRRGYAGEMWERSRQRWENSQPPHRCEYVDVATGPCTAFTRARQKARKGWVWNRFCKDHRARGSLIARHAVLAQRPGYGPNAQRVINQKIGDANRKPASERKRKALDEARKRHKPRSAEFMGLIAVGGRAGRAKGLHSKSPIELLIIEDLVAAADAKAYVRRVIQGHRGRWPVYDLAEIRGDMEAGRPAKAIADRISRSVQWARQLVRLVRRVDECKASTEGIPAILELASVLAGEVAGQNESTSLPMGRESAKVRG